MTDYTTELEKQIEDLQKQLSKSQVELEDANKIIKRNNIHSDDVYTPLESERIEGWYLYNIVEAASSNRVWFHLKRNLWGFFKNTEESFNFVTACDSASTNSFNVKFYSYPKGEHYTTYGEEKKHTLCDGMFNIARQNKFIYVGTHKGAFAALPYGILTSPSRSRNLVNGKIVIKDLV